MLNKSNHNNAHEANQKFKLVKAGTLTYGSAQLPAGLVFVSLVSLAANILINPDGLGTTHFLITFFATSMAHVAGYFAYRRFDIFPGMVASGALLPIFLLTYAIALSAILAFRLDYSRLQLASSLIASVSWYVIVDQIEKRIRPFELSVIPGGDAHRLQAVPGVSWRFLEQATHLPPSTNGVVADLRADLGDSWERFIAQCALAGTPVYHSKQVLESLTGKVEITHLSENNLGSVIPNQAYSNVKHGLDLVFALSALVILSPILIIILLIIMADSPGPPIFRQHRRGHRGKIINVYKFRTMLHEPNTSTASDRNSAMTTSNDARITRVGAILRRTRIDELPQIINIIRGEMSWIGPRPEAAALATWYEQELPFYTYRHIVRPGITGWAQVNQGHVTALDDAQEKLHFDFYYIKNFSIWTDISIALKTIKVIISGHGAR